MADPTTIKGGMVRVLLGNAAIPTVYTNPCGFSSRSVKITKGLEEVQLSDCTDPDKLSWLARDATSLSMSIDGEGVLAVESVETWLDATENANSIPIKVEWQLPTKIITWTGNAHAESFEVGAEDRKRVKAKASLQSDGAMVRSPSSPSNVTAPLITGQAKVGQVLTASDGSWTGQPVPAITRQWKKNGTNIAAATAATYTPVTGDIGAVITVTVTATNTQGAVSATSAGTAAVIA